MTTLAIGLRKIRAYQLERHGETWPTEVIQSEASDPPFGQALGETEPPQADRLPTPSSLLNPPISRARTEEAAAFPQPEAKAEAPLLPEALYASTTPDRPPPQTLTQSQEEDGANPGGAEDQETNVLSVLPLTLAQAAALFLEEEQALGRGPETLDWHQRGLKHLQAYLSRRRLSLLNSVTETEIRGWLAFLRAEPSATGAIRTANTALTAARSAHAFCAWAVRQGYLECTPFVRGMVPWYRNRESTWQHIQLIEPALFEQVLRACRPPGSQGEEDHATARNRAMLWMMLEMGLLVSEVCALSSKNGRNVAP